MTLCKNCGHEANWFDVATNIRNKEFYHAGKHGSFDNQCYEIGCGCTSPEPESSTIEIMYNKNPHGKADIGITTAELSQ